MHSRRSFLKASATVAAGTTFAPIRGSAEAKSPRHARESGETRTSHSSLAPSPSDTNGLADHALMRQLARRAVEAAQAAGAEYADARLTRFVGKTHVIHSSEELAVGVRALVNGNWGFAASPYWTPDEMAVLGRTAVSQAMASRASKDPQEFLASSPVTGSWTMPLEVDPFSVTIEERNDFTDALNRFCVEYSHGIAKLDGDIRAVRKEQVLVTSEGTDCTQTTWKTIAELQLLITWNGRQLKMPFRKLDPAGRGWELLRDAQLRTQVPELLEEGLRMMSLPGKPFDIGRYEVVVSAPLMAMLVSRTIGAASELDRALGFEANAGGTSYLGPKPLALLGTLRVASPIMTITSDRDFPGGLATVRWDDEGVIPDTASLVTNGMLSDYQTTRSTASFLAPWYLQQQRTTRSHGYAASESCLLYTSPSPRDS